MIPGIGNGRHIYYWKTKGLSDERINSIKTSEWNLTSYLNYYDVNKIRVGLNRVCLKQDQGIIRLKEIVNIYVVNEITNTFHLALLN